MSIDQTTPDTILGQGVRSTEWNLSRLRLWHSFCQKYRVGEDSVPLFESDEDGLVLSTEIGTGRRRKILQRSSAMEALMRQEGKKAIDDHNAATGLYDGIIYMMHTQGTDGGVVPCYIGKSETVGKTSGVLSANLVRLATDSSKFGRWGDNYAYHIGDLSAIVLPGHDAACTPYFLGEFESARQYAMRAIQIWHSEGIEPAVEEVDIPITSTLCYAAMSEWHLGEIASAHANLDKAISLAKGLNDMHGLAVDLLWATLLGYCERNPAEVERCASDLIELSTRHHFAHYMAVGAILRGWARSASGNTTEGIAWIEDGSQDYRAIGAIIGIASHLTMKAEALYLADRAPEALEAINEAEAMLERTGEGHWRAEHYRLRGVLLAAIGAEETQIQASFCEAIKIAKQQKSVSLGKRAEATYAEYRRQKAIGSGGRGFRLPLW